MACEVLKRLSIKGDKIVQSRDPDIDLNSVKTTWQHSICVTNPYTNN